MSTTILGSTYLLSPMQQGMLFHNLYAPQSGVFIQQLVATLHEEMDVAAFRRAWQRVIDRHPILRSSFRWEGLLEPVQDAHSQVALPVEQQDWRGLARGEQEYRLEIYLRADRRRGFELSEAPLMRLAVFRLADDVAQFVWTSHHALLDNRSRAIVLREVFAHYEAFRRGENLTQELPRPFAEYVEWLRKQDAGAAEGFWRETLRGFAAPTTMIETRPANDLMDAEEDFGEQQLTLSPRAVAALRALAAQEGLSVGTVIRGAWALLLSRYSGDSDVVFGDARAYGREQVAGGDSMVGLFLQTLPFRARVSPDATALALLEEVQAQQDAALPFAHAPLARVHEWSEVARGRQLFESIVLVEGDLCPCVLRDVMGARCRSADDVRIIEQTGYPLSLYANLGTDLRVKVSYSRRRFDDATATRLLGHVRTILEGIAESPRRRLGDVPMLTTEERRQHLVEWNGTRLEYEDARPVHEMIAAQAERAPNAPAVVAGDETLTYAELNRRANQLAHRLRRLGVGPETLVGLCVDRSIEMIVGVLGVLKSGGAYVPIDPSYPAERIAYMMADSRVSVMVSQRHLAPVTDSAEVPVTLYLDDESLAAESTAEPRDGARLDHLAYVIYTSGSTGRPKGVMVTHANLCHYVQAMRIPLGIVADDRYLHTASIAFSSSVRQLLMPLTTGAAIVIATRREIGEPALLFELIRQREVTVIDIVPSYWQHCIQTLEGMSPAERAPLLANKLRLILAASEPLPSDVPERWSFGLGHPARLINMFGQTETTGIVSVYAIPSHEQNGRIVCIGRPIANTRIYLLDANSQPVPVGIPGELCIAGYGLGRGYLNQPELTAERFVADPFVAEPGARMYRTGDRARYLADGTLEFLGRGDNQVKIRGFRVEVEEVEAVLRQHPAVREAVVTALGDVGGERKLVAYFSARHKPVPTVDELRRFLKQQLPDYMVPSAFVLLEAIPRLPNQKVNRPALPAPDLSRPELESGYVAPRTPTEEVVAGVWADVLGLARVGVEDNFFALGGHSLMAARVVARIRTALSVEVPLRALFDTPTVSAMAAAVETWRRETAARAAVPALVAAAHEGERPLSFSQQRMWLLNQIEPDSAAYNLSAVIRMKGLLDRGALERTLAEVVRRHESLRTVFPNHDGNASQIVMPAGTVELPVTDLAFFGDSLAAREARAHELATEEAKRAFDLATGPLFRAVLVKLDDIDHVLVMTMHHIVSDGWSRGVLYREVGALYDAFAANRPSPLAELPVQYADYARWQREWLTDGVLEPQISYWKQALAALPTLDLPADRPRPPVQTFKGATKSFHLPASLSAGLRALCTREESTLFMTLLAAFQALLGRYSGQEDIVVGSPIAGRTQVETENLIGFFVNTLVMRADLSNDPTFSELLKRVRESALGAYANQDVPFERLVDALQPTRDLSRSPLFQVLFILQNVPSAPLQLSGLEMSTMEVDAGAAKFDITLSVVADDHGFVGHVEYNTDLFDAATVDRLMGHYRTLLEAVVADSDRKLSQLPILTEGERKEILVEWNDTARAIRGGDKRIDQLVAEQAARTPDATALAFESRTMTYRELDERSNQLARHLQRMGVGPDVLVGVYVERSIEMMVGLLGVLKAGGAYVPLDPTYPRDRVAYMIEDSRAAVLLTQQRLARRLPKGGSARVVAIDGDWDLVARESSSPVQSLATPANLAYVIYTSGSTGKPKGVMVEHRNVVNFFTGMDERIGGQEPGTWLAVTSISFDISVLELFYTLTRGFKVVIQGEDDRRRAVDAAQGGSVAVKSDRKLGFSLFYFASAAEKEGDNKYKLLIEGAKFADRNGFEAVWTPERHFHEFGGLYPSPAVANAAVAAVTERVKLRTGSVVLPLHNVVRVAEDWSVVDNISKGRVGLAFASGWHDRDFVFQPDNYADRRNVMFQQIEQLRALWRGGSVTLKSGAGKDVEIRTLPRPVQAELPIWITAAGTPETYVKAGEIGANLLTHLLGQSVEQMGEKIKMYREARQRGGHDRGHVSLMMHTFIGENADEVRETVRGPFRQYLSTAVDLIKGLAGERGQDMRASNFTKEDMEALLDHAFERYYETSALLGTPEKCLALIEKLKEIGVDEIACLIDFGVPTDQTLQALEMLAEVKDMAQPHVDADGQDYSIPAQLRRHAVTHFQCTPSMAAMLSMQDEGRSALGGLQKLMVGGEALPPALADELRLAVLGEVVNMYGPTETAIWSSTHTLTALKGSVVPIGKPIANTDLYVVDRQMNPVPAGIPGELFIGGAGVVRGYLNRPELTAERFVANPFRGDAGEARLYRTGDLVKYAVDGTVEFLGRVDHQVKIRGHRIELGEIEAALKAQPGVHETVVVAREDVAGDKRLVGYVTAVPGGEVTLDGAELRNVLRSSLPEYMVPSHVVVLETMPRTPNGKTDRKGLPSPDQVAGASSAAEAAAYVPPGNDLEQQIAAIWQEVLHAPQVGMQDNFFDLGGHSMLVVKVSVKLKAALGRNVAITDLFRFPTVRSLAAHLGGGAASSNGNGQKSAVDQSVDRAAARRQAMLNRRVGRR
ncbi:MAG TPA: amino acid adenylation domain-containing protein [Gemmatimonadaceae bacterium]|nr:amino acid adenylation domain-containing protein [Gemmatimonadaceae bacterium]